MIKRKVGEVHVGLLQDILRVRKKVLRLYKDKYAQLLLNTIEILYFIYIIMI